MLHRRSLILCAPDILRSLTNKLQSLLPILEVLRLPVLITRLFLNSFVFVLLALLWTFLSETNDLPETQVKKEFLALLLRNKCFSIFQLSLFKPLFYKLSNIPNGLNSLGFLLQMSSSSRVVFFVIILEVWLFKLLFSFQPKKWVTQNLCK